MFTLIHGSASNLKEVNGGFKHFNYNIDNMDNKPDNKHINNGNDAKGPGMYNFDGGRYQESLINAATYTGDGDGYIHISTLDIEESELLNNRDINYIDKEDWIECIELFMDKMRFNNNFVISEYDENCEKIRGLMENGQDVSFQKIEGVLEQYSLSIDSEYHCTSLFGGDYQDWKDAVDEVFYMEEPCSHVADEGGVESIVDYAISSSDNQWELLVSIWANIATISGGIYTETYNETFYESVMESLGEKYNVTAALVGEPGVDSFFVVFDPSSELFNIEKVIDLSLTMKHEKTY